jgi:hypothetical protein
MVAGMANHQLKSLELLDEVDRLEVELRKEYARDTPSGARPQVVADLHQRINRALKKSDIHATHALRQTIEDAAMTPAVPA